LNPRPCLQAVVLPDQLGLFAPKTFDRDQSLGNRAGDRKPVRVSENRQPRQCVERVVRRRPSEIHEPAARSPPGCEHVAAWHPSVGVAQGQQRPTGWLDTTSLESRVAPAFICIPGGEQRGAKIRANIGNKKSGHWLMCLPVFAIEANALPSVSP